MLHALEVILITLAENAVTKRRGNNGSGVNTIDAMLVSSVWVGLDDDSLARMTRRLLIVPVEQLLVENKPARRLSSFGYSSGLQNWDCTNLGAVSEILNLSRSDWVPVTFGNVLHAPSPSICLCLRPPINVVWVIPLCHILRELICPQQCRMFVPDLLPPHAHSCRVCHCCFWYCALFLVQRPIKSSLYVFAVNSFFWC